MQLKCYGPKSSLMAKLCLLLVCVLTINVIIIIRGRCSIFEVFILYHQNIKKVCPHISNKLNFCLAIFWNGLRSKQIITFEFGLILLWNFSLNSFPRDYHEHCCRQPNLIFIGFTHRHHTYKVLLFVNLWSIHRSTYRLYSSSISSNLYQLYFKNKHTLKVNTIVLSIVCIYDTKFIVYIYIHVYIKVF